LRQKITFLKEEELRFQLQAGTVRYCKHCMMMD
jgi:hypothetical protein